MNRQHFSVAEDFSRFPGGRTDADGPYSGEHLREILTRIKKPDTITVVDLNGTMGYGSSFLEAAFGGLGGEFFEFVSDDPSLVTEIRSYLPSREELIADRDALLEALSHLAVPLACMREGHKFDPARGTSAECGDCPVCNARKVMLPIVKWIRKGWRPPV